MLKECVHAMMVTQGVTAVGVQIFTSAMAMFVKVCTICILSTYTCMHFICVSTAWKVTAGPTL